MNMRELAQAMLEWEELKTKEAAIEKKIEAAVLELKKTQQVGNVRASYSAGTRSFDYESLSSKATKEQIEKHTKTEVITKVDHRKIVLEELGIIQDEVPFTYSRGESVKLKLTD